MPPVRLRASGRCFYDFLHLVKSREPLSKGSSDSLLDNTWFQEFGGAFALHARIGERLEGCFGLESYLWHTAYGTPENSINRYRSKHVSATVDRAYARYHAGSKGNPFLTATLGLFNMTYAPEAKNLGEYLLRSGVYPGFVISGSGGYDMLGLHLHVLPFRALVLDALFTTELNVFPNFDYSPSFMAHYTVAGVLTVGAGVMFYRLVKVQPQNTTPVSTVFESDSLTCVFTHAGTKLMGRLSLDPKPLLKAGIFGAEDLLIYAEAAILGVENYPYFYEERTERIPVMGGVHIPAFNVLDFCALELEWYGSPWKNNIYNEGLPYPSVEDNPPGHVDDYKWSVSAAKTIPGWMTVTARVARDHWRQEDGYGFYLPTELTTRPGNWYWSIQFTTAFSTGDLRKPWSAHADED